MSQLFETIRILNGKVQQLNYHNLRFNKTRHVLFASAIDLDLSAYIKIPSYYKIGLVKCRISYDENVREIQFSHYTPRKIKSLKLVHSNEIAYEYKYEDRSLLKMLYQTRQGHSEILIVKNALLTDCFYYNIAVFKNGIWYTPKSPLLHGTMRAKLIEEKSIVCKDIHVNELSTYSKISLFNALNDFGETVLDTEQIF